MANITFQCTEELIERYCDISGDRNPVHLSEEKAAKVGLPAKIAHGMLSMAIGATILSPYIPQDGFITDYRVKFFAPLFVNDTLMIECSIVNETCSGKQYRIVGINEREERIFKGTIELSTALT